MGDSTHIQWCDHTGSPWYLCTPISEGCKFCYAEVLSRGRMRGITGGLWGKDKPRVKSKSLWKDALRWNHQAMLKKKRARVFPSLCDPFDAEAPIEWLAEFLQLIHATGHLEWLLLTKRPDEVLGRLDAAWTWLINAKELPWRTEALMTMIGNWCAMGIPPENVSLGVTVENQARADERLGSFRRLPAARKFVSYEPALGAVNWRHWEFVDQIISGGESGKKSQDIRPSHPDWHRNTRNWCGKRGVAYFFKQWGDWTSIYDRDIDDPDWKYCEDIVTRSPNGRWINLAGGHGFHGARVLRIDRIGKKKAVRLLDGREWNQMPGDVRKVWQGAKSHALTGAATERGAS